MKTSSFLPKKSSKDVDTSFSVGLNYTPIHAKYFAHELTLRKASDNDTRLSNALFDSKLEINPHQIDAALFAFKNPLSKGVLLADEVGLGKTIEAGLIACQLWAERKRRQLIIVPASLRKQWHLELKEKFNLDSIILESKSYNELKLTKPNPFESDKIVITSYHFASNNCNDILAVAWDVVIIDEAHKLRNSYKEANKLGQAIKFAIRDRKKILLTATPLQNNLIELYGITSIIDPQIFGDIKVYRANYIAEERFEELKERLNPFCKRTLRKDVVEYIKYTERLPLIEKFSASDDEQNLYDELSKFLQLETTYAIPYRQKHLITMQMRKYMASSTYAILKTLETIRDRLEAVLKGEQALDSNIDGLFDEDEQAIFEDAIEEEALAEDDETLSLREQLLSNLATVDKVKLKAEIAILNEFIKQAEAIPVDTKSKSLLTALTNAFKMIENKGGNRKALIFTESRRTQEYLKKFLESTHYKGKVVAFNGSNSGEQVNEIYKKWKDKNAGTHRISGSLSADKRNAIIDFFKDDAEILIATEAAAEGVNLQFCSLVINYDLPWNPQRIEQRIGRCHRYGQKNDVVVVNFVNERNYADQRVHELLDQKLHLFNGIFGSSDEVLGQIESGVDFEKRILEIYQKARTQEEIQTEFDALQKHLEKKIKQTLKETKDKLFKHFDSDVFDRLKLSVDEYLDKYSRFFWGLTKVVLEKKATFDEDKKAFDYNNNRYYLIHKGEQTLDGQLYRPSHPLGQEIIDKARAIAFNRGKVQFSFSWHMRDGGGKLSQVEQLLNKSGYLTLYKLNISSFEESERLLFAGYTNCGTQLTPEQCEKLFECRGNFYDFMNVSDEAVSRLNGDIEVYKENILAQAVEDDLKFFQQEEERLIRWSDDMIYAVERELDQIKKQIRQLEKESRHATNMNEKLDIQQKINALNSKKRSMRVKLDEAEEDIIKQRKEYIADIKARTKMTHSLDELFTIQWEVI